MFYYIITKLSIAVIDYYLLLGIYYWYHRFIHLPISGPLYRAHYIGHHKLEFPLKRIRAKSYYNDGYGGWFKTGGELIFGIPISIVLLLAYQYLQFNNFIILLADIIGVLFVGDFMHSSYHLTYDATNHPESLYLHRLIVNTKWFVEYRNLHDIHHAKYNANFGFADYTMDKIFGTYKE